MIARIAVALAAAFVAGASAAAETTAGLPVLRAHSRAVDIDDGGRALRGGWTISPDVPLDIYYARRAPGTRKIIFRSDVDVISFDVANGHDYDFTVNLDGQPCCHTRISSRRQMPGRDVAGGSGEPVSIPFTIGGDNKIHVIGSINDSAPLDLLIDIGADTVVLYPSGVEKHATLAFDGDIENAGSGGTVRRRTSSDNRVSAGALRWDHESVLFIEKQSDQCDGILGYNMFDNSLLSIDYDAMVLRIGGEVGDDARRNPLPIRFRGTLPTVDARLSTRDGSFDAQLVLDTGSNATIFIDTATATQNRLPGALPRLGWSRMTGTGSAMIENEVVRLPRLRLASLELHDLPLYVEQPNTGNGSRGPHLGMEILQRLNTAIDLRTDVAYFAPSRFNGDPYRASYRSNRWWVVPALGGAALIVVVFVMLLRRRARGSR